MGQWMSCSTFQILIWNTKKVALIYEFQHWDTELFPDSDDVRPAAWIKRSSDSSSRATTSWPPRFVEDDRPIYDDEFFEVKQFRTMPIYIIGIRTEWGLIKQYTFCSGVGLAEWTRVLISLAQARSWFHRKPRSPHWAVSFAKPGWGRREILSFAVENISLGLQQIFQEGQQAAVEDLTPRDLSIFKKASWTGLCDVVTTLWAWKMEPLHLNRCPNVLLSAVHCTLRQKAVFLGWRSALILRNLCLDQYPTQWPQEETCQASGGQIPWLHSPIRSM